MGKKVEDAKVEKVVKEPKVKIESAGSIACKLILDGASFEDILAAVIEVHPESKFNKQHLAWYRAKLIKEGKLEKPVKAEKAAKEEKAAPAKGVPAKKSTRG